MRKLKRIQSLVWFVIIVTCKEGDDNSYELSDIVININDEHIAIFYSKAVFVISQEYFFDYLTLVVYGDNNYTVQY